MENKDFVVLVTEMFKASLAELMQSYGFEAFDSEPGCRVLETATNAFVDGVSIDFEIMVTLRIPYASLERSYPGSQDIDQFVDEALLEDWLCEICNLLIGSIKQKLVRHDCHLQIGLPQKNDEEDIRLILPEEFEHNFHYLNIAHENAECVISLQFLNDYVNCLPEQNEQEDVRRSELELF
jgi:hypothetical protein